MYMVDGLPMKVSKVVMICMRMSEQTWIMSVLNWSTAGHWYQGGALEDGQDSSQKARLSVDI